MNWTNPGLVRAAAEAAPSDLRTAAAAISTHRSVDRALAQRIARAYRNEADAEAFDVFLSHAARDALAALGVWALLRRHDPPFIAYLDWIYDPGLDRTQVTDATADTLRRRMRESRCLLFVASRTAARSRWMPWELGYFDGHHGRERVGILPVTASRRPFEGREYLQLYRRLSFGEAAALIGLSKELGARPAGGENDVAAFLADAMKDAKLAKPGLQDHFDATMKQLPRMDLSQVMQEVSAYTSMASEALRKRLGGK